MNDWMPSKTERQEQGKRARRATSIAFAASLAALIVAPALAAPPTPEQAREEAKRIHDRLAGVPPSATVLADMQTDLLAEDPIGAAYRAMENSNFYNVTLKNFATPWTNEAQTVFEPLNDYTATVIGMVRDDVPFNTLLSANLVYVGAGVNGLPPYSPSDNEHYEFLEDNGIDLKTALTDTQQSLVSGLPANATAGVMTTRAAAKAFFVAGTNRAMFRFTMLNHLCNDMEQVKDSTRVPDRIRQDVSRSPGGDSRIFLNNCIGCHAGMDPMTQAYAYYDYDETDGRLVYTPGQVQPKNLINGENFKYGFVTADDRWDNYWRSGPNAWLGWDANRPGGGFGAKTMGEELASSDAFAQCQVRKVFKAVCFRGPEDDADRQQLQAMVTSFKTNTYRMKQVFAEAAAYCRAPKNRGAQP